MQMCSNLKVLNSALFFVQVIDNYYSFQHQNVERVSKLPSTHKQEGLASEPNVCIKFIYLILVKLKLVSTVKVWFNII